MCKQATAVAAGFVFLRRPSICLVLVNADLQERSHGENFFRRGTNVSLKPEMDTS